jgi:hypothetical protein
MQFSLDLKGGGVLPAKFQAVRDQQLRWIHQPDRVARSLSAHHYCHGRGHIWHGKLPADMPFIIGQDLAHGPPHTCADNSSATSGTAASD